MASEDGNVFTSLSTSVLQRVLTDNHTPDLSEQVLSQLGISERHIDDSASSTESLSEEDWSYNGLLSSVLTDEAMDHDSLTDAIMSRLQLDEGAEEDVLTDTAL